MCGTTAAKALTPRGARRGQNVTSVTQKNGLYLAATVDRHSI